MKRLLVSSFLGLSILASTAAASADVPNPKSSGDSAAAQALFYEARALMKEGKHAVACPKLEESLRLDYGIGTEFNLADCNEKVGKIASAWSQFINVAASSRAQNQPQREKVARERAKALEPRLPRLSIDVVATATPGLEVKRDGVAMAGTSWGTPLPVDPGLHRITASAPGRQTWEGVITATETKIARITVPQLRAAAGDQAVGAVAVPVPGQGVAPQQPPPQQQQPTQQAYEAPATASTVDKFPSPIIEQRGSTQRTVGYIIGGAGLASLGVGVGFGINSIQKHDRAARHCDGDVCDPIGVSLRQQAINSGDVATVTGIAGGAALLGGVVLVLTAPRGSSRGERPTAASRLQAIPHVASNGGGVVISGVLP